MRVRECNVQSSSCICSVLVCAGDSEDELDDNEPQLETVMVQHPSAVNRIRVSCLCPL